MNISATGKYGALAVHAIIWLCPPVKESTYYLNIVQKADPKAYRKEWRTLEERKCDSISVEQLISHRCTADGAAASRAAEDIQDGHASTARSSGGQHLPITGPECYERTPGLLAPLHSIANTPCMSGAL